MQTRFIIDWWISFLTAETLHDISRVNIRGAGYLGKHNPRFGLAAGPVGLSYVINASDLSTVTPGNYAQVCRRYLHCYPVMLSPEKLGHVAEWAQRNI